jgi:autotransporter adhesin
VSGNNSGAIGDPNVVTGNDSYAIGNNNTIAANKSFALGNNITIASSLDGSVVLGDGSSAKAATSVTSATVNNVAFTGFAGGAPTSTVSVGAVGTERQITNVAAGQITATSTDAVNGSQVYTVANTLTANTNTVAQGTAAAIGGGTKYDTTTQAWTGPNYTLPGITGQYTDAVSGLQVTAAVASAAATGQLGPVRYTPGNPNSVTMIPAPGGSGPVVINNVAPGLVAPGSLQAVNGGQLYAMGMQTLTMANQYTDQRVQQIQNYARSGVALGVAMAQLHYNAVQAGDISVSASAGMFDGAAATAAGIRMQINDRISVGGQLSFDPSSGYFAGGLSGSIRFH